MIWGRDEDTGNGLGLGQNSLSMVDHVTNGSIVARSLNSVFPDHVDHFQMAFDQGDVMLEDLYL